MIARIKEGQWKITLRKSYAFKKEKLLVSTPYIDFNAFCVGTKDQIVEYSLRIKKPNCKAKHFGNSLYIAGSAQVGNEPLTILYKDAHLRILSVGDKHYFLALRVE